MAASSITREQRLQLISECRVRGMSDPQWCTMHGGCRWTHVRRHFIDAISQGKEFDISIPAVQVVRCCDKSFEIERKYHEKGYSFVE